MRVYRNRNPYPVSWFFLPLLCPLLLLLPASTCMAGDAGSVDLPRYFRVFHLAQCLEEFRERELFEFAYRHAHIDTNAQEKFILAVLYHHGLGVERDAAQAARWYREADREGYSFHQLGREADKAYRELIAVGVVPWTEASLLTEEPDETEKQALAAGGAVMLELSNRYFLGLCAPLDFDKADLWQARAADSGGNGGNAQSGSPGLDSLLDELTARQGGTERKNSDAAPAAPAQRFVIDPARSRPITELALEFFEEGRRSFDGDGTPVNYYLAGLRFTDAAGFGTLEPMNYYLLGRINEEGLCGDSNPYAAGKNYRLGADLGHAPSMLRLALLHEKGLGVRRSLAEAERLLERAALAGVDGARENLHRIRAAGRDGRSEEWETSPEFQEVMRLAKQRENIMRELIGGR